MSRSRGTLCFSGETAVSEGKLDGEIQTDGDQNLGDSAIINGNINAQSVVVRGKITGNIVAKDKIEIKTKTELFGDILVGQARRRGGGDLRRQNRSQPEQRSLQRPDRRRPLVPRPGERRSSRGRCQTDLALNECLAQA